MWIVVGCANVQMISVFPFSRFLDGGPNALCFERICFVLKLLQHLVAFQDMNLLTGVQ